MILNDEIVANAEWRKQCGIPIEETPLFTIVCPNEAVGEIGITLEDGTSFDMPICQGHLEDITKHFSVELDSAENSLLQ